MAKRHLELVHSNSGRDFEPIKKAKKARELSPKQKAFKYKSCTSKKRFRTEKEADSFISHLERISGKSNKVFGPLRSYPCSFCNGFHTSSSIDYKKDAA